MANSNRIIGDFHKGDRVILIPNNFHPEPGYPVYGSDYSDVGTVVEVDKRHVSVRVKWDQGPLTNFSPGYIDLFDDYITMLSKPDPNRSFKDQKYSRLRKARTTIFDRTSTYAEWKEQQKSD